MKHKEMMKKVFTELVGKEIKDIDVVGVDKHKKLLNVTMKFVGGGFSSLLMKEIKEGYGSVTMKVCLGSRGDGDWYIEVVAYMGEKLEILYRLKYDDGDEKYKRYVELMKKKRLDELTPEEQKEFDFLDGGRLEKVKNSIEESKRTGEIIIK